VTEKEVKNKSIKPNLEAPMQKKMDKKVISQMMVRKIRIKSSTELCFLLNFFLIRKSTLEFSHMDFP
jgi:hypothetical protein